MADPAQQLSSRGEPRAPWTLVLVAVLGLWAARGVLVLSQADVFGYEEFAKAALGRALLDDLGVEHYRLAYHYYELGGFLFSHLDALCFMLIGPSLLALKIVALAWQTALLVVVLLLAHRAFGSRGATLSALMFVLAPESLQKLSLLALGIHFESILFHAWILLQAGRIAVDASARKRDFAVLGLACGLGLSMDLTTLAACLCAALTVVAWAPRSLAGGRWLWLIGGLIVGMLPWILMAIQVGPAILDLHGEQLGSGKSWSAVFAQLGNFATSLFQGRTALDLIDLVLRGLLFLWGLTLIVRGTRSQQNWARLLFAHLAIFCAAYVASRLAVGRVMHYNEFSRPSVAWLSFCLLSAGALACALRGPSMLKVMLARAAVVALVSLGLRSLVVAMGPLPPSRWGESFATLASTSGCTYGQSMSELYSHLEGSPKERVAIMLRLSEPSRERLEPQLGNAVICSQVASLDEGLSMARELGGEHWQGFALGLGRIVLRESNRDIQQVAGILARFDAEEQRVLFEAGGRFAMSSATALESLAGDIAAAWQARLPEAWFEGQGYRLGQVHVVDAQVPFHRLKSIHPGYDRRAGFEFIAKQPQAVRAALERGWMRALNEQEIR